MALTREEIRGRSKAMDTNQKQVKKGLDDIKRQVPGIVDKSDKKQNIPSQLMDEELFYRVLQR